MENNQLLLSICIPTNGIVDWVIPAIDSIYIQGVDNTLFEVVVTDNGEKNDLQDAVKKYNHPNFHYYKTDSQGFTNQIDAFEKCSGLFCKMLNHRSKMLPESLNILIELVERYKNDKPIIYCAEGHANGGDIIECSNTDEFVRHLSYWVSWSAGTGAWKSDLVNLRRKKINKMFPHTVYLFELREESKYVIWNSRYQKMQDDTGKGGYDLFKTFGVIFLDVLNDLRVRNRITNETFKYVKKDLYSFLCDLYYHEVLLLSKHSFIIKDISKSMNVYYGPIYYWKMVFMARLHKMNLRRFIPFSMKH